VISALLIPFLQIDLPSPPVPGGDAVTEWWRVIALIAVTVLTTGILALIFRPAVPLPASDRDADQTGAELHTVPSNIAPLRRATDQSIAPGVIPFPGVTPSPAPGQTVQTSRAAAERLRRLTQQSRTNSMSPRRRLGSRPDQHEPGRTTGAEQEMPATETNEATPNDVTLDDRDKGVMPESNREAGEGDTMAGTPDTWELRDDNAERLPSSADASLHVPPGFVTPDDLDSLGDLGNQAPNELDRLVTGPAVNVPTMSGNPPSDSDVDQLADRPPFGKIVPFVPRPSQHADVELDPDYDILTEFQAQNESVITQFPVDLNTREEVTATVQELLFCANVGEFIHGFALYTDKFLFTFMDQSGMNEDEFRERFSSIPARDPSDWTRIEAIREFRRLDDGRITATVQYVNGGTVAGRERYVFKQDAQTTRWLIDDIAPAD
jgi:hypothetical protein